MTPSRTLNSDIPVLDLCFIKIFLPEEIHISCREIASSASALGLRLSDHSLVAVLHPAHILGVDKFFPGQFAP